MTVAQANKIVRALIGEDDFCEIKDVIASYYSIAQRQIATTVCPIIRGAFVECGKKVPLPADLYRIKSVPASYTKEGSSYITVEGEGKVYIIYYAYPAPIPDDCDGTTEFEVDAEAQSALPFYAAAQTVLADSDMRRYYAYMDSYNNILSNIAAANKHAVLNIIKTEAL